MRETYLQVDTCKTYDAQMKLLFGHLFGWYYSYLNIEPLCDIWENNEYESWRIEGM